MGIAFSKVLHNECLLQKTSAMRWGFLLGERMDIVYVLKNGIHGDELKYSLRSLKNFTHDKVWFYGGKPEGLVPDVMVEYSQHGRSKWEKVRNMLIAD